MKRIMLGAAIGAIGLFGSFAQATELGGVLRATTAGPATQISETEYSLSATASIKGLVGGSVSNTNYNCTVIGLGNLAEPVYNNFAPNDEVTWNVTCTQVDGGTETVSAALTGSNRPLRRNGAPESGLSLFQISGPISLNGDDHGHVATCKGLVQFPVVELACAVL